MSCQQNGTPQKALILFTRYPQAGKVKTRLIKCLGPTGAAELHRRMTEQVIRNIEPAVQRNKVQLQIYSCGGTEEEMQSWLGTDFLLTQQQGNDLGERMLHAFVRTWRQGAERVLLIGSDCPGIESSIIESGLKNLAGHDLVLGPAADGGYYLIGLRAGVRANMQADAQQCRQHYNSLFRNIDWGSGQVLQQTVRQAEKAGLSFALLPELHDIDRPEDLVHLNYYPDPE